MLEKLIAGCILFTTVTACGFMLGHIIEASTCTPSATIIVPSMPIIEPVCYKLVCN